MLNHKDIKTKERLLMHAEILFAQRGFHAVSVREITTAAKSNLAAVNYYFDSKKNLYLEVFRLRWVPRARQIKESFESVLAEKENPGIKEIFGALAHAFIEGPLDDEARKVHVQLMQREIASPTEAFELVANEVMAPFFEDLSHRLQPCLPKDTDETSLVLSKISMLAVVLYFNFSRAVVTRFTGQEYDSKFKTRLIEHIAAFSRDGFNSLLRKENL
ncbi:MAG: CerR family C-terminal domain-containing protein [Deltaproteobacteria bacterium]|nr:CerR family C-terminal domain-containing protein [Deltaproteobacteria bacterium]